MAITYSIQEGQLCEISSKYSHRYYLNKFRSFLKKITYLLLSVSGSWSATWYVYYNSINPLISDDGSLYFQLSECITTGALFATFGSAVIAVFTLSTSMSLTRFYEDLTILMQDLNAAETGAIQWRRWSFIPRIRKINFAKKTKYFGLNNATISYHIGTVNAVFVLPTTVADFKEISLLSNAIRMQILQKKYMSELERSAAMEEYPAWACVVDIYRSALRYRFSNLCVWVGVCFVLQSIIFSFFYPTFYVIMFQLCIF